METTHTYLKPALGWTNILVPVDFSETSLQGLKLAIGLAEKTGAALTLLHVVHVPVCYPMDALQDLDELISSGRDSLDNIAGIIRPTLIRQTLVRFGYEGVAREIVEVAVEQSADLIVVTSCEHNSLKRVIHGSTADAIIRHAPCPVLVAPTGKNGSQRLPAHAANPQGVMKRATI